MFNIHNKTVMITGAARGIGYKYAEILLRNGAKRIAIIDLPTSNGPTAAATLEKEFGRGRAVFYACDVTKAEDLEKTFKEVVDAFEGLDILINNAGVVDNNWERTIDVNIKALIHSSFLAMDYMGKHKGGKGGVIVNVASQLALHPCSFLPVYTATKHGVLGFSQALADLYDKTGVRVLIMCPGYTETELGKNISDRSCDLVRTVLGNVDDGFKDYPKQSVEHVALAMLDLIQKGKNGAAWVCEGGQPPYAVDFVHYSKRALPV
ncbi:15-hydroxyprostaglandin dehydrogenase [NAD(+)]-like [Pogonomyrmex barbatus]|uniref:15-hydroxyprostaglandin dehydrogenase [NAD(+)] n=1 Tax=Pogonomyrmex barbatus TaxID=144034 RepID=A0A6I9VVM1_9HYME|nr:15-hydroxyprostaglandin dehydrogenase [NAD(+)]-like [Pogonomyrmex barbatus]